MSNQHSLAVLFADVSGSTALYEHLGDQEAHDLVAQCIGRLRDATQRQGGIVVKEIGDAILATFPTPEAAALASIAMQEAQQNETLSIRVAFNYGEVVESVVGRWLADPEARARVCEAARRLARPHAADTIARRVLAEIGAAQKLSA